MKEPSEMTVAAAAAERWFHVGPHLVGVSSRKARVFSRHRDLDIGMAMLALLIAAVLFWPGISITVGSEGSWAASISTHGWGAILLGLGLLRVAAVKINGIWQTSMSATIRAIAAFVSMAFWGQILWVSATAAAVAGRPSIGLAIFFWFWACEARCIVRAIDDAGSIRRATKLARTVHEPG